MQEGGNEVELVIVHPLIDASTKIASFFGFSNDDR